MRSGSTRALAVALLLTLAAPAPRMTAWLLGSSPANAFAAGRNEPQARGRNRLPSPAGATVREVRAGLASGGGIPIVRPPGAERHRDASKPLRRPGRPGALLSASFIGPIRLRC